jgi:hypothetical protein
MAMKKRGMPESAFTQHSTLSTQHSQVSTQHFTPRTWAIQLAEENGIVDAWLAGATVLDPTCGRGDLLLGLMTSATRRGCSASELPVQRLFGVEREPTFLRALVSDARREFGLEIPRENLQRADFLQDEIQFSADVLFGNPPWINFCDLIDDEKAALKPLFMRYGLVPDRRRLLLGASRVDVAALVVVKAIVDHLQSGGTGTFFLPLSLLTGEGAHAGFRRYCAASVSFAVTKVRDLTELAVFPGVATRYGTVSFQRDAIPHWPIQWRDATERWAAPLDGPDGSLAIADSPTALDRLRQRPRIVVPPGSRPRQGVNPCGASKLLFIRDVVPLDDERADATSAAVGRVVLPRRFLYPLLTADQFENPTAPPRRWVLLPHDPETSQPLTLGQVTACPELAEYLERCRPMLENRRGQWLRQWIDRGRWWALLGVGPYCFASYRVTWPAYGATRFTPCVFAAPWQGQQALHAHIACKSLGDAQRLAAALSRPEVEEYLRAFGTAGTRSFAQPGRVARVLEDQMSSHTTT